MGINPVSGSDLRVVNNEIYDWSAHAIQLGYNGGPTIPGYVIENNDVYVTSAMYLGDGRARAKNTLSVKANGSSSNISKIIHNRIWGARKNSLAVCCLDIDAGAAMYLSMNGPFSYILIQNNLFMDSQRGLAFYNGTANHISIIGNIFSGMAQYYASDSSHAIEQAGGLEYSEIYLNSFINNAQYGASFDSGNLDVLCNVLATGGDREGGTPNSSTQADHNVFYDTTLWSFNGTDTKIDKSVSTRTNSNAYSVGAILRTGAASSCVNATDTACFLYKVTTAGTSAGSAPSYCTTLGCTTNDGTMTVQAMRGPYTFYRKLRTSPEPYTIPYARAHASAPETGACPSGYASRSGVGINDVN